MILTINNKTSIDMSHIFLACSEVVEADALGVHVMKIDGVIVEILYESTRDEMEDLTYSRITVA